MKQVIVYVVVLLTLGIVLVACADGEETAEPSEAPAQAEEATVKELAEDEQEAVLEPTAEAVQEEPQTEVVEATEEEISQEEAAGEEQPAPEGEAAAVQPPPMDDPSLMPVERFEMFVDDLPVEGWGKTIAAGAALDSVVGPSNNGFPPFIFVDFSSPGDAVFPDPTAVFTFDVPQGRIFPMAHYLAMYEEGGRDFAQEAVSTLQQILDERPQTLDETLLTLPGFGDAQQGLRGKPTYFDFEGGSGVGFVAGYGQEIGPLLNDTLVYQFVGLTETHSDTPYGTQYISFVFPLAANFLSDLESVSDDEIAEAEADLEAYLAVTCNDLYSGFDIDTVFDEYRNAEAPQLLNQIDLFVSYIARCEHYGLTEGEGELSEPVTSSLPILVVNGSVDKNTAARWGESTFEHLPNAQMVTVPLVAHGASALSACGQDITNAFFTYPGQELDDTCTETLQPDFVLPQDDLGLKGVDGS